MIIDWGLVLIAAFCIVIGGIVFSPTFRKKFFVGFRKFMGWSSKQKTGTREPVNDPRDVQRKYIRTIHLVRCETCKGTGHVPIPVPKLVDARLVKGTKICPTCDGTGEVEED